ncbi:MAG: tetratricopeptide repeat protein [candidate division WOR-3 bacterium]
MNISELKKRAREYELRGDYKKALETYQTILKYENNDPETLFRIGQILIKFKQEKKAGEFLLKSFEIFEKQGIYDKRTIALLKKLIQLYPDKKDLYRKLAEAYYHVGDYGEAGKTLEFYIEFLFKNGEYEKGFENYELLLRWQPENFALKERVAELYLDFKKNKRAIEIYFELLSYFFNRNKEKEKEIRNKLLSLGVSEKEIEERISSDSESEEKDSVFVTLDELLKGDRPKVTRTLKQVKETEKEEKVEMVEMKEIEKEIQKEVEEEFSQEVSNMEFGSEAAVSEEEVLESEIKNPFKVKTLAETLLMMGDYTGALDTFYKAFELYLQENLVIEAYNILKEIASKWPEEIKARKEMVKISHMLKNKDLLVDSIISLAECLYKRGAKDDALKWFLKVLDIEPDNKKAIEFVTMISPESLEKLQKSKVEVPLKKEKTVKVEEPKTPEKEFVKIEKKKTFEEEKKEEFIDLKSQIFEELEEEEKKIKKDIFSEVRETLHKFSKEIDYKGKLELGIAMREMGLYEEAIINLKEALNSEETRAKSLELLGEIFMELRKFNIAIEYFEKALQEKNLEERRLISIEYHLGQCYENLGDPVNALTYYKRAYEKDPEIMGLKDKIEELESNRRRVVDEDKISFL